MFRNPIWQALTTDHAALAQGGDLARRYPADVLPFCAVAQPGEEAMLALGELVAAGEPSYLCTDGETPFAVPGLTLSRPLPVLQMLWPTDRARDAAGDAQPSSDAQPPGNAQPTIDALTAADAPAMVGLTDVAFPGLFRPRTHVLGNYFGIRADGELIAMAGERFSLHGYREISAVCTHPQHTGRGLAAGLIRRVLAEQAERGLGSLLHVAEKNARAIALYERLGFVHSSTIFMYKLTRS
jgi:GNAT superfamily N-acetyltransferase